METLLLNQNFAVVFCALFVFCIFCWVYPKQIIRVTVKIYYVFYTIISVAFYEMKLFFRKKTKTVLAKLLEFPVLRKSIALAILTSILLYVRTDTAIGIQCFSTTMIASFFCSILLYTRNTAKLGKTEAYTVPRIYYTGIAVTIVMGLLSYLYNNNLVCGSYLNQGLTISLLFLFAYESVFLGKYIMETDEKNITRYAGENERLTRHIQGHW